MAYFSDKLVSGLSLYSARREQKGKASERGESAACIFVKRIMAWRGGFLYRLGAAEWYLSGSGRFWPGGGSESAFGKKRCRDFFREAAETYCYFPVYLFLLAFFQGWKSDEGVRNDKRYPEYGLDDPDKRQSLQSRGADRIFQGIAAGDNFSVLG